MKLLKKAGAFLLDVIEIYIPMATFAIMFFVFILQIFFRYVLRMPLTWPYEVTIVAFIWTAMLGACFAIRKQEHVEFTIVYDKLSEKRKLITRIIGNIIISFSFLIGSVPIYNFLQFLAFKKTGVLRIPFNIAFAPFLVMVLIVIGRAISNIVIDVRQISNKDKLLKKDVVEVD